MTRDMANGDQMDDVAEARLARTHLLGVRKHLVCFGSGHDVGTSRCVRKASSSNFACPLMLLVASTTWPLFGLSDPHERSAEARDSGAKTPIRLWESQWISLLMWMHHMRPTR